MNLINSYKDRFLYLILLLSSILLVQTGCDKDDNLDAKPTITRIRSNKPSPDDSTLTKVLPGQTFIIEGKGFTNTTKIYFNNVQAAFNPTYITDNHIVVTVPANLPFGSLKPEDLNKIRIVTTTGELSYEFPVIPPPAAVSSVSLEFLNPAGGQKIKITGNYLYLINKIIFPGNKEGTNIVSSVDGTWAEVTVPAGVTETGGFTVVTAGGTASSAPAVILNDAAHVFYDFDAKNAYTSWNNPEKPVIVTPANPYAPIPFLTGNYIHWVASNITPGSWWVQDLATPSDGSKLAYPSDIPNNEPTSNLAFKFEMNVPEPGLKDGRIEFNFEWQYAYFWKPAADGDYKTAGWKTITVPLTLFNGDLKNKKYGDLKGKALNILFINGDGKVATNVDIGWDNFRIVKVK